MAEEIIFPDTLDDDELTESEKALNSLLTDLSGMDGIIAILNHYWDASGIHGPRLTGTSKLVKIIYDWIHGAYDGRYNHTQDRYVDYRTTFFEKEELSRIAEHLQPK